MTFGYLKLSLGIHWEYYFTTLVIMGLALCRTKKIALSLLLSYMFLIFSVTVLSRTASDHLEYDLQLFRLFRKTEWWHDKDGIEQVIDNIIMFVPIGLLLPLSVRQGGFTFIALGAIFSVILEACQLIFCRGLCEVDDVIANTCGVIIGCLIFQVYRRIRI